MSVIMNVRDTLSAKMAECYVTIENNRYNFMQAINLTAKVENKNSGAYIRKNRQR